jgi:hypothetical protein
MPKLKDVAIVTLGKSIPNQDYENLVTFFDLIGDGTKLSSLLTEGKYDLVGMIPSRFSLRFKNSIATIVNTFNKNPESIAFMVFPPIVNGSCPYFINSRILPIENQVSSIEEMLQLVESQGLLAKQATEEIFSYDD